MHTQHVQTSWTQCEPEEYTHTVGFNLYEVQKLKKKIKFGHQQMQNTIRRDTVLSCKVELKIWGLKIQRKEIVN